MCCLICQVAGINANPVCHRVQGVGCVEDAYDRLDTAWLKKHGQALIETHLGGSVELSHLSTNICTFNSLSHVTVGTVVSVSTATVW